jgi:Ser/Thr protein kinase RdoA (MazF antagonist)
VPQAPAPLEAADGGTWIDDEGRVASLWPFIEGRPMDRHSASDRAAAGRMLGSLHTALAEVRGRESRPGYSALVEADWLENRWWSWSGADLSDVRERVEIETFERALEEVPEALRSLQSESLPRIPVHGDYYEGNLLIGEDGEVSAVLDWDECRLDWRAWDVANALWSFCRNDSNSGLDDELAAQFLEAYEPMAGALLAGERAAMGLLIRASRLWEALWGLGEMQRGRTGWDYFELNVSAVEGLRGFELE